MQLYLFCLFSLNEYCIRIQNENKNIRRVVHFTFDKNRRKVTRILEMHRLLPTFHCMGIGANFAYVVTCPHNLIVVTLLGIAAKQKSPDCIDFSPRECGFTPRLLRLCN